MMLLENWIQMEESGSKPLSEKQQGAVLGHINHLHTLSTSHFLSSSGHSPVSPPFRINYTFSINVLMRAAGAGV